MGNPVLNPKFSIDSFVSPEEIKALYDEMERIVGWKTLTKDGYQKNLVQSPLPSTFKGKNYPTLSAGLPNAKVVDYYGPSNEEAMVFANPEASDYIFRNRNSMANQTEKQQIQNILHEATHLYKKKGFGVKGDTPKQVSAKYTKQFDKMVGDTTGKTRRKFVLQLVGLGDYIKNKYDEQDSAYFSPYILELYSKKGWDVSDIFDEQIAVLSSIEERIKAENPTFDITKDPNLASVFSNPKVVKAFNAFTGLRQTRLDAKDLRPFTVDQ